MPRRLFEQSTEVTPSNLSDRLAYGRSGIPTKNISWTNIVSWLNSVLSFLKPSNNFSDLGDIPTARTNLDVYDTTTIDDALDLKADKSNVLEKDNTTSFTPTQDYHPATKKYVDEGGTQLAWANATKINGSLTAPSFMRCARVGPWVQITGIIEMSSIPAENTILFTLPGSFPLFVETHYIPASDANNDENYEMKALTGTRNIVMGGGGSTNTQAYFCATILVI